MNEPKHVVGDGALGIWAALRDVYPAAGRQACWYMRSSVPCRTTGDSVAKTGSNGARNAAPSDCCAIVTQIAGLVSLCLLVVVKKRGSAWSLADAWVLACVLARIQKLAAAIVGGRVGVLGRDG